jgi:hypothetical protein
MATLEDIKQLTIAHIGGRGNVDSLVESRVNRATLHVTVANMPHEMRADTTVTTSEGTPAYTLVSDCYAIREVRNDTDEVIISPGTLRDYASSGWTTYGTPTLWIREGNQIVLYHSIPDDNGGDNYTIRYWYLKRPSYMDDTTDTFPLNYEWEEPVALLAASKVLSLLNEPEGAMAKYQEYEAETTLIMTPGEVEAKIPERRVEFYSPSSYRAGYGVRY